MRAKVEYGGVQKYIEVPQTDEDFDFFQFIQEVTDKFSLQAQLLTEDVLILTGTSDTEVDADIFDELIKSGVRNFKLRLRSVLQVDGGLQKYTLLPSYLLLFSEEKKLIQRIFIDVDQEAIPSDAQKTVTAFDGAIQSSLCPQLLL